MITLLVMLGFQSKAQYDSSSVHKSGYPLLIPKVEIANLLNPEDPSLLLSLEVFPFLRWVSLSQEIGFVNEIRSEEDVKVVSSLKYRSEIRFYPFDMVSDALPVHFYMGADFQYRGLTIRDRYILGFECEDGCVYYQNFEGNIPTDRYSYQVRLGGQVRLDRFVLEADYGFGEYYYTVDRGAINGGKIVERDRFLSEPAFGRQVYMTFRTKIGYSLFMKSRK